MARLIILSVLTVTAAVLVSAAPTDSKVSALDCPGGLENGGLLERGRFYYVCRDGAIIPMGCVGDDLKKMTIGATFDRTHYRLRCQLNGDGNLEYEPVSCLFNGADHKIDERWEDGSNFYICKKTSTGELSSVNLGCIDQGRRVNLNEKVNKDDFVYACNATVNNGARLMPVQCVKEGRQYSEGESFESGKFWFTCIRTGREKLSVKSSGCVNGGRRLNDGDRYSENDVIYECTIEGSGVNAVRTVACQSEGGVERKLGCTWVEGQAPFQYEWRCEHDASTGTARKVQVRCNYNLNGGSYQIEAGCYRLVEKSAVGCLKETGGSNLKLQSFQGDNAEQAANGAGLRTC
jgi:hypothetical protein